MISLASSSSKSRNQQGKTAQASANTRTSTSKLQQLGATVSRNIWLPDSPATFSFFILTLAILCGGLFLHINLSAQIAQSRYDIEGLENRYNEVERENAEIVSQIAIATSMFDIFNRATALGYVPLTERDKNFVAASEIVIPQPQIVSAPPQARPQSMKVADAFAATDQVTPFIAANRVTDDVADAVPLGSADGGEQFVIGDQAGAQPNNTESFGRWLAGLWTND